MTFALASLAILFTAANAHSGVWNIDIDGINYPARDARIDGTLGAKRIEWSFKNERNIPWAGIKNVSSPDITCGGDPKPPALKAIARGGANVTIQWSGIVRTHYGPVMSYLAHLPGADTKPQDLSFFKIDEKGYNAQSKLWANEELIKADRKDTLQLPSDIKSGTYVLRTELLALHYATTPNKGPEFYPHCFNIQIHGDGSATPTGVKFPGGYLQTDPSIVFKLYTAPPPSSTENNWEGYQIPGPPKYAGKYESPTGPAPVVADADRGIFPDAAFQAKYEAFKKRADAEGMQFIKKLNDVQKEYGHRQYTAESEKALDPIFLEQFANLRSYEPVVAQLRQEGVRIGVLT